MENQQNDLARRLLIAAGRVEKTVYFKPMTTDDAAFRLDWSDALIGLAENLIGRRRR